MSSEEKREVVTTDEVLSDMFKEAFRYHPAGVAVITAQSSAGPVALTVSSLISVSASPPIVAFSLSSLSTSAKQILDAHSIVIHLIGYSNLEIAQLGATPGIDRFEDATQWEFLPTGEPRYLSVPTWFRATINNTMTVENATLVAATLTAGEVEEVAADGRSHSLIYVNKRWHGIDHDAP